MQIILHVVSLTSPLFLLALLGLPGLYYLRRRKADAAAATNA